MTFIYLLMVLSASVPMHLNVETVAVYSTPEACLEQAKFMTENLGRKNVVCVVVAR